MLVLEQIEGYENEEKGEKPVARKRSRAFDEETDEAPTPLKPVIEPGEKLGRSGKKYVGWQKPILLQCLQFLSPKKFPAGK
eukprot:6387328-Amphidinium_carterae.1